METRGGPLARLGVSISEARKRLGLSQADLAARLSLSQAQISYFESGRSRPTLDQLLRIAGALDVPIQWLISGSVRPGKGLADLAIELRRLGIEDLWVKGAVVPGAFRRPEEVVSLALSPREPDPRIVEAIPAVLAWNETNPTLLRAYGAATRTRARIAWLADVALAIDRQGGFPGGCQKGHLERFLSNLETTGKARKAMLLRPWDDLGKPLPGPPTSPIWKRWRINYDASLKEFEERARHLHDLRIGPTRRKVARPLLAARASRKDAEGSVDTPKTKTIGARKPGEGDGVGRS